MKEIRKLDKESFTELLFSLSKKKFNELYKDTLELIEIYKDKYQENFLMGEFIETDYSSLLKERLKILRKKYGELQYEILNKDDMGRNLKEKIDDKASIREALTNIFIKHKLTQHHITLEFLPSILSVKEKRIKEKKREKELFRKFDSIYQKIISASRSSLDEEIKEKSFTYFLNIWNKIKKGTKFRAPQILSPITIFMFLHMKGINLDIKDICKKMKISDKEFRQTLNEIIKIYPDYLKRDREILVRSKLESLETSLKFPAEFKRNANAILEKFWPFIQQTIETVIAGTVAVLTAIGMDIKTKNYFQICEKIGCTQSAVLYQIKNKIFKALHIPGFESIQKSREMIKELILKNIDIKILQ